MAPNKRSIKGRKKLSPEEIFGELAEMKMHIEAKCFVPDPDDDLNIPDNARYKASFEFHRSIIDDLRPDADSIEDDLITNAAIYAHYAFQLAEARRYLARCEHEYNMLWGRVYQKRSKAIWKDPDLDPKIKTQTYIKADVDNTQSVALMVNIIDDAKKMVQQFEEALKALEQKHYNCQAISRMRAGEARLIGSTYVAPDQRRSGRTSRPYDDDETKEE